MLNGWIVLTAAFGYIGALFAVASYGDRQGQRGRAGFLIYPLSLAIYCTSWTFFGSVGVASHAGIEFIAIYIGPIVMFALCTPLLTRIVRLAKAQKITSIADFIAARYGKSQAVAATVALIAIIGSVPYIALQLKAVASALETLLIRSPTAAPNASSVGGDIALMAAGAMAVFAIAFGTRHTDATEHQHGLMLAIATESVVKLFAFVAVGACVTFLLFGPSELLTRARANPGAAQVMGYLPSAGSFVVSALLSFFAILLLPRQFHVSVVENAHESEIRVARWMFPLYLVVINLFVLPIALAGLLTFPAGSIDSDMYVLALPLAAGQQWLTIIALIGGLSAATAMVIVESVALAVMVSNHIVMPVILHRNAAVPANNQDVAATILTARRIAIAVMLLLAYLYYRSAGTAQLASIGLLSFAAAAQLAPAFFGGLIWQRATAIGAIGGMVTGFIVWAYTLLLPSFADAGMIAADVMRDGLFGIAALRPQALLNTDLPPLVHGVIWSLATNTLTYIALSLARQPSSIEAVQADIFSPPQFVAIPPNFRRWRTAVTVGDLIEAVSQYLGAERTRAAFAEFAASHGTTLEPTAPADFQLLRQAERLIASTIGVASSRRVLSLLLRRRTVSAKAALRLLDDAHAALHYNQEILQTALNHVRQGIAVFNKDLLLICSNRQFAELLDLPGYAVQVGIALPSILALLGRKAQHPATRDLVAKQLAAYTTEGEPFLERFLDRNLVVEVRVNRMPDGGIVITFSDTTPSVEAAEALERANATLERRVRERTEQLTKLNTELARAKTEADDANISKTRFLAAASHDLLQPLHAARLYMASLADRGVAAEEKRLIDNIDESLDSIEQLLGALLDISRLDAGALKPSISGFRSSDILRSLEVEFAPIAREKGLDLRIVQCSVTIQSDRILLLRLLQNLTSNAIKYTPKGKVLIGCRRHGRALRFDVYDRGVGIPESKRRDIFKEFFRLEQGARIARGLGLGLSIVQRMARMLNHGIALEANRSGGSHFSVTVPISDAVTLLGPLTTPVTVSRMPLEGALIVCVENEPMVLDGMRTLLTGWGAEVIAVTDGGAAIEAITASRRIPSGLLVDYHLDRGNGIAAIGEIRAKFGDDLPAVLVTADRSPKVREAVRAQNIRLMGKPVKPAALRAMLSQWSRKRILAAE